VVLRLAGSALRRRLANGIHTVNLFSFQPLPSSLLLFLLGPGALYASVGCDSESGESSERALERLRSRLSAAPPALNSSLAVALGVDAGEFEGRVDPPAPAGDLKAEIERFTTVDACVEERARLDPILGDALEAIGYDTFLRDACRVIDATKANDATRCEGIDSSSLAARCRTTVAEIAGQPGECPWQIPDHPAVGRAPACIAVATRDARLCAAVADSLERATCEASLTRNESPCATLRGQGQKARCARDGERWRTILAGSATEATTEPLVATGTLHVTGVNDRGDAATESIDVNLAPDLERGVILIEQRDGARLVIGPLTETGVDFIAPSPHVRASLALELLAPSDPPGVQGATATARVMRVELLLPGRPPVTSPGAHSTLAVKVERLVHARGGGVKLMIEGDLASAGPTWHLRAEETTFVRDIVRARDLYGGNSKFGADSGMR
jgi:hypothetical protein